MSRAGCSAFPWHNDPWHLMPRRRAVVSPAAPELGRLTLLFAKAVATRKGRDDFARSLAEPGMISSRGIASHERSGAGHREAWLNLNYVSPPATLPLSRTPRVNAAIAAQGARSAGRAR